VAAWNTPRSHVVIIPIVALTALVLTLNVVAPSSADVRVVKYVVQVIPQVAAACSRSGRANGWSRKAAAVPHRPTQYQIELAAAKARLAADERSSCRPARAGRRLGRCAAAAGAAEVRQRQVARCGRSWNWRGCG